MRLLDTIDYQPFGPAHSYRLAAVTGTPTLSRHHDSDGRIDRYTLGDTVKILSYDRLGNLTTVSDENGTNTQNYSYDALNRLTDDSAPGHYQHYDYDANGNRTQQQQG